MENSLQYGAEEEVKKKSPLAEWLSPHEKGMSLLCKS